MTLTREETIKEEKKHLEKLSDVYGLISKLEIFAGKNNIEGKEAGSKLRAYFERPMPYKRMYEVERHMRYLNLINFISIFDENYNASNVSLETLADDLYQMIVKCKGS